jgi:hypothetical protein
VLEPRRAERLIAALLASEDFDEIADTLQQILALAWDEAGEAGLEAVLEFLTAQDGPFTPDLVDGMNEVLDDYMGGRMADRVSGIVRESVNLAYGLGQEQIRAGLSASFNLPDRRAMAWLHQHEMYWTRTHFTREWTERIGNLAEVAIRDGLSRRDAGLFFQNTLGEAFRGESESYWSVVADAITTRSRSFGSTEAFVKAGVTRYMVDGISDHRQSEICKYLDGKVFEVADAVRVRDAMIAAPTPEDAKQIMPWAKPADVVDKSTEALAAMGIVAPPFHGNCRSRLVIA